MTARPRISIVICTYERPQLLSAALASIFRLEGLDRAVLDVVVVDNSESGSARASVEAAAAGAQVKVTLTAAHPPNISVARNVGVAATDADVIAFLDDDQEVQPGWLDAVVDGLDRFPQDVFFGPIVPRFESEAAATEPARVLFTRFSDAAAGMEVLAIGRRTGQFPLSTANSIFRRARTLAGPAPFDVRLGQCGGEDLHLFNRLQRAGCSFGWLPDAGASDFVPTRRCGFGYLLARHYAGGQAYAAALIWTSPTPLRDEILLIGKASIQIPMLLPKVAVAAIARQRSAAALAFRLAGIVGKLTWRRLHPLYRNESRGTPAAAPARVTTQAASVRR